MALLLHVYQPSAIPGSCNLKSTASNKSHLLLVEYRFSIIGADKLPVHLLQSVPRPAIRAKWFVQIPIRCAIRSPDDTLWIVFKLLIEISLCSQVNVKRVLW